MALEKQIISDMLMKFVASRSSSYFSDDVKIDLCNVLTNKAIEQGGSVLGVTKEAQKEINDILSLSGNMGEIVDANELIRAARCDLFQKYKHVLNPAQEIVARKRLIDDQSFRKISQDSLLPQGSIIAIFEQSLGILLKKPNDTLLKKTLSKFSTKKSNPPSSQGVIDALERLNAKDVIKKKAMQESKNFSDQAKESVSI